MEDTYEDDEFDDIEPSPKSVKPDTIFTSLENKRLVDNQILRQKTQMVQDVDFSDDYDDGEDLPERNIPTTSILQTSA